MKQNLFFVLIAIAILYLIYSFSKNTPKQLHKKKLVKETFNQLGNVATEIDDYSVTFLDQELDQEMDPEYWRRLNSNLVFSNSNLLIEIDNLEKSLDEVRLDISQLTSNNDYLTGEIDKLTDLNATLVDFIREKSGCETNNPKYGISNCSHIFDVDIMKTYKSTLKTTFQNLVDKLNTMLVQDHYNELDAGTLELKYENVRVQHIQRIIDNLESIKNAYHQFYQQLQMSYETLNTNTWDTTASTIMTKAQFNCENRFTTDECIYATKSNGITIGYFQSNMNHVFHSNLWPSEDSCEKDPDSNCHSIGELSSSNCDGNKKTCYDLISDDPVNSSHSNNDDKLGHISYNSASYGYTSEQLSNDNGELIGQWSCKLNYPSQADRGHTCKTESNVRDEARINCEGGLESASWGVDSYDCYTNTSINEADGFATYIGAEELPDVDYVQRDDKGRSKVWSNTSNDDGTFGTCTVDDACRTLAETSNMAACLTQANSNDYTMNYKCYGTSGSNTDIQSQSNGNYRKKYQLGSFDSNETNKWTNGTCYDAPTNYIDCRTKADVDAEVDWKTTANWQCHTYSNGEVNALEQWNKNYEVNTVFGTNSNIGTKSYTSECRKKEDAEAYEYCVNENQYFCWEDQGSNPESNIKKQFSKQKTKNKNYTEVATTSNDRYAGMSRPAFDQNCTTTSNCTSSNDAYDTVREHCEASNVRSTCYKEGTVSSNPFGDEVSWSIVYDSNSDFEQYSTRVINGTTNIKCEERDNCDSQSNVCESKSNKCYTQPTYDSNASSNFFDMTSNNYKSSILDSSGSNCVASSDCVTLPYCSYMTVETDDSNDFVWGDIGRNDCSDPSEGKRYRWTLETNSVASASNPSGFIDTDDTSNSNHWRAVNSPENSSNSFCTPVNTMVGKGVTTITTEDGQSEILCQCQSSNDQHYALRYYAGAFDSNSPSNIGYSSLSNLQSSNCESNECRARNYYTAQERLVLCTHPDGLASNAQGEPDLGDKYLGITLSNNGLLCYNGNACSNLCLVSGPSTTSTTQIGDGIYDREDPSKPAKCFKYGTSNQQNQFSYAANGSLLTTMPTCTDFVDEECSSNQNPYCGYPDSGIPWSNIEEVSYTRNKSATITIDHEPEHIYVDNPVTKSNNTIRYNTQCGNANSTDNTPMKALFKRTRVVPVNDDGKCIVQSSNITQFKYSIETVNEYCPQNCRGSWSGCEYDEPGHRNIKTWTTNVPGDHGGTACTNNNGAVKTDGCQQPVDCVFSRWGDWSPCPPCGTGNDLLVSATRSKIGPFYNGHQCSGSLTQSSTTQCSTVKPCCRRDSYGDWNYEDGTPFTWNGSDNPPCETRYTRSKTLDVTSCTNTAGLPVTVTDSKTNSQSCNTPCVGSWSVWTTCADTCGTTPTQRRTFSINTPQVGNQQNHSCFNVAKNDQSLTPDKGLMDNLSDKTKNSGSFVITKNCPTNLPCCDASKPYHYKENGFIYNGGTEAQFDNVALAPCGNGTINKMKTYVRDGSVCKDGALKDPTLFISRNTLRCCTNNDFRENVNYTANPTYTPPRLESLEGHFYNTNKMPCSTTITKTTSYSKKYACSGNRDDITDTKTSRDCAADNVIATNVFESQQFLIQQDYNSKSTKTSIPVINQNLRNYIKPGIGNLDLTNIANDSKYIYWQSGKEFTFWVGSYVGCSFYYKNVRVDFSVGTNNFHIFVNSTRNNWTKHTHNDGRHHYPTQNLYGKCLGKFKTSNMSGMLIKSIKVTADVKSVYGGSVSNPGNGFWICTDKAFNGSTCTAPLIATINGISSPP
jgi:hypothetical protein